MHTRTTVRNLVRGAITVLLTVGVAIGVLWNAPAGSAGGNVIVTVDTTGSWTSLALDSSGNPVVSYYDNVDGDLRILHCGNPNCTSGNSITLPDTTGNVGRFTSLVLDGSGNPVVSYYDDTNRDLKILHCNDPDCAGGDESITSPDTDGNVGAWNSLALDTSGNPVVSYYDATVNNNENLKVLHCNDPNCAGDDESITLPDTAGNVGRFTALALDASGNPVVSYYRATSTALGPAVLKVLHCGNPNCGPGNVITTPDANDDNIAGNPGWYTSLALDANGNPVISYQNHGANLGSLKILHCGDATCSAGNSITWPDGDGWHGLYTSLALDSSGNPVVSYWRAFAQDLKLMRCNDVDCAGDDESITSPDTDGRAGEFSSLALDASDNPVVSYAGGGNLKILHCGDPNCGAGEPETPTSTASDTATPTAPAPDTATPTSPAPATATSTPAPATSTPPETNTPGDVNCDGTVNAIDAALILQWSAGLFSTFACEQNADVNGDGSINSIDAALILQFVAGLLPSL